MSRCQHCNKLTHSEHLIVYYEGSDHDKICELMSLTAWTSSYHYLKDDEHYASREFGKLKCGDIYIHFRMKNPITSG
jgi:hypothetical protein